jgi:membrane associated rhomboid family serine protease
MGDGSGAKICAICGEDCSTRPRVKDPKGRYFCRSCYERAMRRRQAVGSPRPPEPVDIFDAIQRSEGAEADEGAAPRFDISTAPGLAFGGYRCPGCDAELPIGTVICVKCGIHVGTGRSVLTSRALVESELRQRAERVLRPLSWLTGFGLSPIASEALGHRRPYATWAIAALTCLVSIWFWFSTARQMDSRKDLMLWAGGAPPSAELILDYYEWTDWGDPEALRRKVAEIAPESARRQPLQSVPDEYILAAYEELTPRQRATGRFHGHQLLTHALLHGDVFHLLGNLVFLLIFGSRVNAVWGSIATAALYPLLAVLAAVAQLTASAGGEPQPMLGASGAIMGFAGMYLVLFPANRVHMAAWFRWWFYFRMKIWVMRGFWVVMAYICFDIFFIALGAETGTAHWAHLGGFLAGLAVALGMLLSRFLNAGGGDIISIALGRRAWRLLGRPVDRGALGLHVPAFDQQEASRSIEAAAGVAAPARRGTIGAPGSGRRPGRRP